MEIPTLDECLKIREDAMDAIECEINRLKTKKFESMQHYDSQITPLEERLIALGFAVVRPSRLTDTTPDAEKMVAWLRSNPGWHAPSEIKEAVMYRGPGALSIMLAPFIDAGQVERQGEARWTQYRATRPAEPLPKINNPLFVSEES